MMVIANVFRRVQTVKDLVRPLSTKCCFRTCFDSQHVKGSQTLVKSAWELFSHIFSLVWAKMIWKISPYWNFKSYGCFLIHWLPMTSILFEIIRICSSLLKYNCFKSEKLFLYFSFNLWNFHQISDILK